MGAGGSGKLRDAAWVVALAVLAAVSTAHAAPAEKAYSVAPPRAWVDAPDWVPSQPPEGQIRNGAWYLLSDHQVRLSEQTRESYRAFAIMAVNASGVDVAANIQIVFDPSYQSLTLHGVDVIRGGERMPRLTQSSVQVLQREPGLEYRIFDGSQTLSVTLEDVRVGDVVEYAYTQTGSNPVFGGREFGRFQLQFNEPARHLRARLSVAASRTISILDGNAAPEARISEGAGFRDYRWSVANATAHAVEAGSPGWYDPYPYVSWSEFHDWAAVVRWAEPLYRLPARLPPELRAEIASIARAGDPGARALEALRFVQREIRYLGVEIGPGSHAPNQPSLVFQRRFGDCKDKALLLLAMLRELGIEARAALVNTAGWPVEQVRQPHPGAFDHVIVRATIDGKDYWLDPTRSPQKGDLDHVFQPDFGQALVVDRSVDSPSSMRNASADQNRRHVRAVLDARGGFTGPVPYTVTTTAEGGAAEGMRNAFAVANIDQLQQDYANFYARYFPGISVASAMRVGGEDADNRVVVDEHYLIRDLPRWDASGFRFEAAVDVPDLAELLADPAPAIRRAPLSRTFPYEFEQVTEILLPDPWPFTPGTVEVEDAAFSYSRQISGEGARIVLHDRYRAKTPVVAAADMTGYIANLARARDATAYSLQWSDAANAPAGADGPHWPLVGASALFFAGWIYLALRVWRWDPPATGGHVDSTLTGFGGWLLLPAFGILATPIRLVVENVASLDVLKSSVWANLAVEGGTGYHELWAPGIVFTAAANIGLVVFSLLLVGLLVRRRRSLAWVYTVFVLGNLAVLLVDQWLSAQVLPDDPTLQHGAPRIIGGAVASFCWIAYFHLSVRVRSTFTRTHARTNPRQDVRVTSTALEAT